MAIPQRTTTGQATARPRKPAPPGTLRPLQARSLATREALLSACRALLAEREFDALSVADMAAAIGMSVGSFYGRFRDKEAFFEVLQTQVTDEWRQRLHHELAALQGRELPAAALAAKVCSLISQLMREDSGFLRSALKHASTHPGSWTPIKQIAQEAVDGIVPLFAHKLPHLPATQRAARVRFGMQVVYGTCLNAVLHDPGPIMLNSPRLARELATVMCLYLEVRPPVFSTRRTAVRIAPED